MNNVFAIKNTEFNFKKMTKVVCLATLDAKSALAVVVDDGLWSMVVIHNTGY